MWFIPFSSPHFKEGSGPHLFGNHLYYCLPLFNNRSGPKSTLSEKAYVGIRVCVFWPSLFHGKTQLPVCVLLPTSVLLFYLSKLFWHLGLNTQAESSLNDPISFKVTTHQLESEPGHRPRRGPGFLPLCVKWHEIRAQDYKHLKQLGLHSPLSRWDVSSFARSDLSCRHLQIQPDCWVFFFNLFSTVKNKKTPTIKYILKKKTQNPNPTKQQQNPQNQQKTPTKQVGESEW